MPLLDLIGNTPLVRLATGTSAPVELYAKAEWANPGGSVKDRAARHMILDGEHTGALTPAKTIVDATSGNTGIAYAMIAAARGYKVLLFVPGNISTMRRRILQAYGAELRFTDPLAGTDGAIHAVRECVGRDPERYFYPNQYDNPANWRAHFETTAEEIWAQTSGRVTHFVAGLGTTGTFVGTGRRLRELNPRLRLVAMQPDSPYHGLEGMKHLPTAILPAIYDATLADEQVTISTEEAYATARSLARDEGLFVGPSAAGNVATARRLAARLDRGVVVTILCDGGDRYANDHFWDET